MAIGLPLGVYIANQRTALLENNGGSVEFRITNAFLIVRDLQEVLKGDKQFMEQNINVYFELYAPNVTNKITGRQETLICSKDTIDSPAVLGGGLATFCDSVYGYGSCDFDLLPILRRNCQCTDFDYLGYCETALCSSTEINLLLVRSDRRNNAYGYVYWPSRCKDILMISGSLNVDHPDIDVILLVFGLPMLVAALILIIRFEKGDEINEWRHRNCCKCQEIPEPQTRTRLLQHPHSRPSPPLHSRVEPYIMRVDIQEAPPRWQEKEPVVRPIPPEENKECIFSMEPITQEYPYIQCSTCHTNMELRGVIEWSRYSGRSGCPVCRQVFPREMEVYRTPTQSVVSEQQNQI